MKGLPGCYLVANLPVGAWKDSHWKRILRFGPKNLVRLQQRQKRASQLLERFAKCAEQCLSLGGHVTFAMPEKSSFWLQDEIISLMVRYNLSTTTLPRKFERKKPEPSPKTMFEGSSASAKSDGELDAVINTLAPDAGQDASGHNADEHD